MNVPQMEYVIDDQTKVNY